MAWWTRTEKLFYNLGAWESAVRKKTLKFMKGMKSCFLSLHALPGESSRIGS
jgi:hypothetical protein